MFINTWSVCSLIMMLHYHRFSITFTDHQRTEYVYKFEGRINIWRSMLISAYIRNNSTILYRRYYYRLFLKTYGISFICIQLFDTILIFYIYQRMQKKTMVLHPFWINAIKYYKTRIIFHHLLYFTTVVNLAQ